MSVEDTPSSKQLPPARPGPRAPRGKRRSSQNASKHGILAGVLLRDGALGDSQGDFLKLLVGLQKDFEPMSSIENLLLEKLAALLLRLSRVYKADLAVAPLLFKKLQAGLLGDESIVVTESLDRESEIAIVRKTLAPEVLMRYEITLEREFDRTLNQLERMQLMRVGQPVLPLAEVEE